MKREKNLTKSKEFERKKTHNLRWNKDILEEEWEVTMKHDLYQYYTEKSKRRTFHSSTYSTQLEWMPVPSLT